MTNPLKTSINNETASAGGCSAIALAARAAAVRAVTRPARWLCGAAQCHYYDERNPEEEV